MTKKDRMGRDPLSWINGEEEKISPPEISAPEETPLEEAALEEPKEAAPEPNWRRATFLVREDLLDKLKDYAYTRRKSQKEILEEILENALEGKEILPRNRGIHE